MGLKRSLLVASIMVLLAVSLHTRARAQEVASADPFWGDFFTRSTLTGDWKRGLRKDLAAKGVIIDATLTQIGQGVVDGGKRHDWEYGGRGNITTNVDSQKLGLWPGGFLTLELEGNWADSVNGTFRNCRSPSSYRPMPGGCSWSFERANVKKTDVVYERLAATIGRPFFDQVSIGRSSDSNVGTSSETVG